jgi:hypothetical protein
VVPVRIDEPPQREDPLLRLGPVNLQVNREGYFGLHETRRGIWDPGLPLVELGVWHELRLAHDGAELHMVVDGVKRGNGVPMPDGLPPAAHILPACESCGATKLGQPIPSRSRYGPSSPPASGLRRLSVSPALRLYEQDALPPIYAATSMVTHSRITNEALLQSASELALEPTPVVLSEATRQRFNLSVADLDPTARATGRLISPTNLQGSVRIQGQTVLVFSQTYDPRWRLVIEGVANDRHFVANGFANGWLINGRGRLDWELVFRPQRSYFIGITAGIAMVVVASGLLVHWARVSRRPSSSIGDSAWVWA